MKFGRITGTLLSLLAGALLAASCTNYGEDIDEIKKQLEELTTSDVASMKTQLASMSTLINGIQENITNITQFNTNTGNELSTIKSNISSIQQQIDKLLTKAEFEAYKNTNESTISRLMTMIMERVSQAELQTLRELHSSDMTDLLARIQNCVTKADLDKAVADATQTYANDISRLESLIATMLSASDFETFKAEYSSQLANLTSTINQALATKLDTLTYKAFLEQYGNDQASMQTAIEQAVNNLSGSIQEMLTKAAFEAFKSEIDNTLGELEAKVDSLAGSISPDVFAQFKKSVEDAIDSVRTSVSNLETKQGEDVESIQSALSEVRGTLSTLSETLSAYQVEMNGTIASLQASVEKFDQKVDTSVFNAFKAELDSALLDLKLKHTNDIQLLREAMSSKLDEAEFAKFKAVYDSSMAVVNRALSTIVSSDEVAEFKAQLDEIRTQLKPAVDSLNTVVDTLSAKVAGLESTTATLLTAIEQSTRTLTVQISALDKRVTDLENKYLILSGKVDKLVSRIQSIMYIPDYADRMIVLESSGNSYKTSTIRFEVRPAAMAKAIVAARSDTLATIKFITREVSTRAASASMEIVSMSADNSGVLTVTARFNPQESTSDAFAIALYIKDSDGNDMTSDYITVVKKATPPTPEEEPTVIGRWILYRYINLDTDTGNWGDPELVEQAPGGAEYSYLLLNSGGTFASNLNFGGSGDWTQDDSNLNIAGSVASETFTIEELTDDSMTLISADGKTKWLWLKIDQDANPYFYYGNFFGYGIEIGERVWAPVNLGYKPDDYPQGLLFQWGRSDGQGYADSRYEDASVPEIVTGTVTPAAAHYNTFYRTADEPYDWNAEPSDYLWKNSAGKKAEYDPCPDGWKVPLPIDFNLLKITTKTQKWDSSAKAYVFSTGTATLTLPAAGQRAGDTAEAPATGRGSKGFYWTCEPTSVGPYSLVFDSEGASVSTEYGERQRGMAIRCVKE